MSPGVGARQQIFASWLESLGAFGVAVGFPSWTGDEPISRHPSGAFSMVLPHTTHSKLLISRAVNNPAIINRPSNWKGSSASAEYPATSSAGSDQLGNLVDSQT
jgi:hypothetical protein